MIGKDVTIDVGGQPVSAKFIEVTDPIQWKVVQINYKLNGENFVMTVKQDANGTLLIGTTKYSILSTVKPGLTSGWTVEWFPGSTTIVPNPIIKDIPGWTVEWSPTWVTTNTVTTVGDPTILPYKEVGSVTTKQNIVESTTASNVGNILSKKEKRIAQRELKRQNQVVAPTPAPEVKATTPAPEVKATTPAPEVKATTPAPEVKATTPAPEVKATTPAPEVKATTPAPEVKATTPAPEVKATTPAPEVKATTPAPES